MTQPKTQFDQLQEWRSNHPKLSGMDPSEWLSRAPDLGLFLKDDKDKDDEDNGAAPVSYDELIAQRGQHAEAMDALVRTAAESDPKRGLTDEERADYDAAKTQFDGVVTQIRAIEVEETDARFAVDHAARMEQFAPALIGRVAEPVSATRTLDELFWASVESVPAGSVNGAGEFMANQHGARASVEPTLVLSRGGIETPAPLISEFREEDGRRIRTFQKLVTDMILFGLVTGKKGRNLDSQSAFRAAREDPRFADKYESALRAMDVDTAAEGGNWVPTGIGSTLHEKVRASGKIAALFARINIPTNPWKWPLEAADSTAYRVVEPISDSATGPAASTPGTGAATFDAEIFGARSLTSRSLDADSAIAILPFMTNKLAQAFADAEERAILDGDADGTHQDGDTDSAGATDAAWAWDGLRKKGLAQTLTDASAAEISQTLVRTARGAMGKYGLNPANLALIVGVRDYYNLLDEADFATVDKFGPMAVNLNGQLGAFDGVPVIVSEHVREDLNASGVEDGITTDRSYALLVNRGEWAMGQREALDVEVDDSLYRETYQRLVIGFMREDFQHIGDAATNDDTSILINTIA